MNITLKHIYRADLEFSSSGDKFIQGKNPIFQGKGGGGQDFVGVKEFMENLKFKNSGLVHCL